MNLLEVNGLYKRFGELIAVDGLSFSVEVGEVFGLLGPNGAGKSTTMMIIAGLLVPDSGSITLSGQPVTPHNRELRRILGVVPQDLAIYPDLTARENLDFFGRLYGLRSRALNERIKEVLDRIGLTGRSDDLVGTFSGGMKRRLNFGIALLHRPRLLILDEPTVGVDPQSRSHLLDAVRELSAEGMGVIYASHYMEEVQAVCGRVAIIDHGQMLACGDLQDLLGRVSSDLCLRVTPPDPQLVDRLMELDDVRVAEDDRETMTIVLSGCNQNVALETVRLSQANEPIPPVRQRSYESSHPTPDEDPSSSEVEDRSSSEVREIVSSPRLGSRLIRTLELLEEFDVHLCSIETREPSLERLFLQMTGKRLRD